MDDTFGQQSNVSSAQLIPSRQPETRQALLQRLSQWQVIFDTRLQTQLTMLEVLEKYLLSNLRLHYKEGNIDQHFCMTVLDAVLQRMIDRHSVVYNEEQDAPYVWPGASDRGFPAVRREVMIRIVDNKSLEFLEHYKDYLLCHWQVAGDEASLAQMISTRLGEHIAACSAIFKPDQLAGLSVDELREKIETLQDEWHQIGQISALATTQERLQLDAMAQLQLPHWLTALTEPDRILLLALQEQTSQAQTLVDELFGGLTSLKAYARSLAKDYVRLEQDKEVEPDSIQVQLQWKEVVDDSVKSYNLSELLAMGPLRSDSISVLSVTSGTTLRNDPLSLPFMSQLLGDVDAPAGYLQALTDLYGRADVNDAMLDCYEARLRQSAYVARCAGHLSQVGYDKLKALWESEAAQDSASLLRVAGLKLPNALKCADLLLFYREEREGAVDNLLLYAPGKPDSQEWIELTNLRGMSGEIGGWARTEVGRAHLLQQLDPSSRGLAEAFLIEVMKKPTSWDLDIDLRSAVTGFRDALKGSVAMGLANHLKQVELSESPRWYSAMPIDSRRVIGGLNHKVQIHEQLFNEQLAGYEVFLDFAKRTVTQAITPYMRSKGVYESVDPATVLIEYRSSGRARVVSLLDLAIHGYDDNSGIENPKKGVRSSVGQDLVQVRSADLAVYIRRAYLGEKYVEHVRGQFLMADDPAYDLRRRVFKTMLLVKMDRGLRVAHGMSLLNTDEFLRLTRLVTQLSEISATRHPSNPEDVVSREGLLKLTVGGHVVLGVYVFACLCQEGRADPWLYTPDAPDEVTFRKYSSFFGQVIAPLHDYILERVALTARAEVGRSLAALTAKIIFLDALREGHRVIDIRTEFDAYITRAITDVEDITTSRSEMIQGLVLKGVYFAAIPICLLFPPFALLVDAAFLVSSSAQAIKAHIKGDTAGALEHWLEASFGALFAALGTGPAIRGLTAAAKSVKVAVTHMQLSVKKYLRALTLVSAREVGPVVRPIRFKPVQAVKKNPENLQLVTEEGIFQGTYRRPSSATHPETTYYVLRKGKYYQVKKSRHFDSLCLVDARRPGALYQPSIRKAANGKWAYAKVGLLGGGDEVRNLDRVSDLRMAFPDHASPQMARGALQGEAVVATFSEASVDSYLFSLNAQTCVIASLFNPVTKVGAVIHFDHNIRSLIERTVKDVMQRLGGAAKNIRATLVGGDWLSGGADIGGPVRAVLRRQGLRPTWDYWSYSSCLGNTYGVSLDLRTGVTSVFKTSQSQVSHYYSSAMQQAKNARNTDSISRRLRVFQERFRAEPLVQKADGIFRSRQYGQASADEIKRQQFSIEALN